VNESKPLVSGFFRSPAEKAFATFPSNATLTAAAAAAARSSPSAPPAGAHWDNVKVMGAGPSGVPSPRRDATLVYVPGPGGRRVILHGGRLTSGQPALREVGRCRLTPSNPH